MHWAMITPAKVGYGGATPTTAIGKLIVVTLAILGVVVVALITGTVAPSVSAQMERRRIIFEE